MGGIAGILGGLGGLSQGIVQGQQLAQQAQYRQILAALARHQFLQRAQQEAQQQQAQGGAFRAFANLPAAPPPQPPPQPPAQLPQGGLPGAGLPMMPPPQLASGMFPGLIPLIQRDESGGRNIPNQQGPGGTPASTASGYSQITNPTWRDVAPKIGAGAYPTAMSAPKAVQDAATAQLLATRGLQPWQSDRKLIADVYQQLGGDQAQQQARPIVQTVAPQIPPMVQGRMSTTALANAIEKTMPDAPDNVKFLALLNMSQVLAPGEKADLQMQLLQMRQQGQLEAVEMRGQTQAEIAQMRGAAAADLAQLKGEIQGQLQGDREAARADRGAAAPKFGTMDDLMQRWHQDFVDKNKREPSTDEIAAQRQELTAASKPQGRQLAQVTQRLMIGANEVNRAVSAITKLPAGTTLGWFGGTQTAAGEGLTDALKRNLANEVTPQSAQLLRALTNGVSRGLAILESGGSAQGLVGLSTQLQADLPQQGDTGLTIAAKYADIRQITEAATEVLKANPDLSNDQKQLLDQIVQQVKVAIPFTTGDVAQLSANPSDETIGDFARRIGLGGAAGQQQAAPRITNQKAYDALPPGARYVGPDGQERVKP